MAALLLLNGRAALRSAAEESADVASMPGSDSVFLAAGDLHSCVVVKSGELRCWGGNGFGQLGQGHTTDIGDGPGESTVTVDLGLDRRATAIALGAHHSCAITDQGDLRCWGRNDDGQLGQGNTEEIGDSNGESTVGVTLGGRATAVALGFAHSCAIVQAQLVRCWGRNANGQLAQGDTDSIGAGAGASTVLVELGPEVTATAIAAGDFHTCVITDTGTLVCWGGNSNGQLGQGHTNTIGDDPHEGPVPVSLGTHRRAIAVSAGWGTTCAITDLGELRCWGRNEEGQLGQGHQSSIGDDPGESTVAVDIGVGRRAVAVTVGFAHVCAALDDGTVRCWGGNEAGALGQGNSIGWGADPDELPGALAPVPLGGTNRDQDSDGNDRRATPEAGLPSKARKCCAERA